MSDDATAHQRPTLAQVAQLAGVSRSTASLAYSGGPVSDPTRERVFAAARELGYGGPDPLARSLRRGRSGIVGVVIEESLSDAFRDPMNTAMLDGLADETGGMGSGLLLLNDVVDEGAPLLTAPMDAAVLIGCSTRLDRFVAVLRQRGIPVVAIEAEPMEGVLDIALDNREASAAGARHLHELGHRAVSVVTLPISPEHRAGPLPAEWEQLSTSHTAAERMRGVVDVFGPVPGWVAAASTVQAGREAGLAVLQADEPPTAIVAQSDLLALGVIQAAEERGLSVPDDLSVLGFDGIRTDGYGPLRLTTLVQPAVEKGREAGRAIAALLSGGEPKGVLMRSVLREGETTAPPRG